jgi:pilus assembly protein CpaB
MSRPATMSPGRTNRRFIMLAIVLGLIGAILVYAAFSRQSSSGGGGGAATGVPVVVAKSDIPARTKITQSMVEVRLVSKDSRSSLAYADTGAIVNESLVTRFPIAANEQVLSTKVVSLNQSTSTGRSLSFIVPPGMRGFAIKVDAVTDGGGLVLPGDYVDIIVVYDVEFPNNPADPTSRKKAESYFVHTLYQNVEVLAVSQAIEDIVPEATPTAGGQRARNSEGKPDPKAETVTLSLTPEQVQKVYLADGNGRIRLSVRHYGDGDERPLDPMIETELFPRNLPNPFLSR